MEKLKFLQVSEPASPVGQDRQYRFGPFELDLEKHQLARQGTEIRLQPKCFELLTALVKNRDRLVPKEYLMKTLWPETFVEEANLANLVAALRKALGDSPAHSRFIQTVPKVGYRFLEEVAIARSAVDGDVATSAAPLPVRLIVFPFRGDDPNHLTYAFSDDISAALAELNTFVVRSIQLATSFDAEHWNPVHVAEKARVDFIVTGSLTFSDQSIRVVLQIVEAQTATLRKCRSWDAPRNGMAAIRQSVVQAVIQELVRPSSVGSVGIADTGVLKYADAYRGYLMANQLSMTRTVENMTLARDLYVECLEKDPQFAPAWARLGRCQYFLCKFQRGKPARANSAHAAFERAFSLDPNLVLAHALYTPLQSDACQAQDAMLRLYRVLDVHPNSPELLAGLVHACRYCGQHEASVQAHSRAVALDPNAHTSIAHTYFALGEFDRALFWYGTSTGLYLDALILASQERNAEALALLSTRRHKFDSLGAAMYSLDAYLRGDQNAAIAVLRQVQDASVYEPEVRFYMARQAAKLEDSELANTFLASALAGGYWSSMTLQRDPWFAAVRNTPKFEGILKDMQVREEDARLALARNRNSKPHLLKC